MVVDRLGLPNRDSRPGSPSTQVHKMPSSEAMRQEDEDGMSFDSPQEEAAHYREKYRRILDMLDETRAELDEFQASSRELEDELEKELAATEKQQTDLKEKIKRLEAEKEDWRNKHIALQKMHSSSTSAMQREMDNLRSERDKTLVALRDLEMGNDELERNERVAVSSLLDLESKYNRAIEEKTLLEQEIVSREELEVETQRLRDEIRDANNEISMLREQQFRGVPTPPSSISAPRSPVHTSSSPPSLEPIPSGDQQDELHVQKAAPAPPPKVFPRSPMPKSATSSSISAMASPSMKRSNTGMTRSPSGLPSLARSTNTRNLASAAGPASPSPFSRTNFKLPPASPARVVSSTTAQSKGFKLLHAMQARLRATDDKLEKKVPKRNVSNPMPLLATKRTTSAASAPAQSSMTMTAKAPHARVQALAGDITTPSINEKSSVLSPNGWVMVDDEDTPLAHYSRSNRNEPDSPLDPGYRAASQASQTSQKSTSSRLPARPGIPSPLASINSTANGLYKSTSRLPQRTPSRAGTSQLAQSVRPASRAEEHNQGGHGRPMSPSMIPRPSSSMMQAFVPSNSSSSVASGQASTAASYSRANSQNAHRVLGRGPPPKAFPGHSIKSSISTSTASNSSLRKSARRSSVSAPLSSSLTSSGLPQAMPRTPSRPVSVSVLEGTPPPPVPRIPSVHLRESKRGHEQLDRRKSLLNR